MVVVGGVGGEVCVVVVVDVVVVVVVVVGGVQRGGCVQGREETCERIDRWILKQRAYSSENGGVSTCMNTPRYKVWQCAPCWLQMLVQLIGIIAWRELV